MRLVVRIPDDLEEEIQKRIKNKEVSNKSEYIRELIESDIEENPIRDGRILKSANIAVAQIDSVIAFMKISHIEYEGIEKLVHSRDALWKGMQQYV